MDRECRLVIVFLFFLVVISPAIAILSLGFLSKNMLEIALSIFFTSGVFAFFYVEIYSIFADIYDEIDELKDEIEKLKRKR